MATDRYQVLRSPFLFVPVLTRSLTEQTENPYEHSEVDSVPEQTFWVAALAKGCAVGITSFTVGLLLLSLLEQPLSDLAKLIFSRKALIPGNPLKGWLHLTNAVVALWNVRRVYLRERKPSAPVRFD